VFVVETSAPAETEALGAELAVGLRPGDVVLVRGELGAGKTTLVRGAARSLGVSDPVTSPTFGIGHRYRGAGVMVAHLDLYRLASLAREDPGLLEDYLGPDRIAFVEWPEAGGAELEAAAMRVTLTHAGGDRRRIEVCDEREQGEDAGSRRGPGS
jgi:tRNA threonylcarbamoyladenosine biosynthesis protein TsaE